MPGRPKKAVKKDAKEVKYIEFELSEEARESTGITILKLSPPLLGNSLELDFGAFESGKVDGGDILQILEACANEINDPSVLRKLPLTEATLICQECQVFFQKTVIKKKLYYK